MGFLMKFNYLFKVSRNNFLKKSQKRKDQLTVQYTTAIMRSSIIDFGFFKKSIAYHYQHLYASKKWLNWIYQFVFLGFGILFLIFAIIIFFKTGNHNLGFYFTDSFYVKNGVNATCLFLSIAAFLAGYQIHPEREAMHHLLSKIQGDLNVPEKHMQIEFNAILANMKDV